MIRLAALVAIAAVVAACSTPEAAPEPGPTRSAVASSPGTASERIFYSFLRQPSTIDPGLAVESDDLTVVDQIFDSLTAAGPDLEPVPAVAASWEVNGPPDPAADPPQPEPATVFTFHLRPDATFHDGRAVTADAFKRAWRRIVDRTGPTPSPAHYLLETVRGFEEAQAGGDLAGVTVVDARTLRVELSAPFSDFPAVVSHPALAPVPELAVEDPEAFGRQPVGNGPFAVAEPWTPGESPGIRLTAVEDHPDQPQLDQLVYRIYEGDEAAQAAYEDFEQGNLQYAPVPAGQTAGAVQQYGAAQDRTGYRGPGVLDGIKLITAFYGFNTEAAPFDDPAVRQALSLLIDRDALAEQVAGEARAPARSIVPPGIGPYQPAECGFCEYDPGRAQELLVDKGIGPANGGQPIELVYYEGAEHEVVAQRVAQDVNAAIGDGTLVPTALSQADWLDAIRTGQAQFFLSGWLAEYPSEDTFLYPLFHERRINLDNLTRYRNPQVNDLLDRARRESDPAARADLYRQAEAIVLQDMPVIPLFFYRHARVVASGVEGFVLDPLGDVNMADVSFEPAA